MSQHTPAAIESFYQSQVYALIDMPARSICVQFKAELHKKPVVNLDFPKKIQKTEKRYDGEPCM
jgi:hypothetical protein